MTQRSGWGETYLFAISEGSSFAAFDVVQDMTIVRNRWGSVAVRFAVYGQSHGNGGSFTLRLDAASEYVQVFFAKYAAAAASLARPTGPAQISATYGGSQAKSSADTNGHKWTLFVPNNASVLPSYIVPEAGLGIGITGPETWSGPAESAQEFFTAQDISQMMVEL